MFFGVPSALSTVNLKHEKFCKNNHNTAGLLTYAYFESCGKQSHYVYISLALSNFYGTKIEICAGYGPVGNTEKTFWNIMSNF